MLSGETFLMINNLNGVVSKLKIHIYKIHNRKILFFYLSQNFQMINSENQNKSKRCLVSSPLLANELNFDTEFVLMHAIKFQLSGSKCQIIKILKEPRES